MAVTELALLHLKNNKGITAPSNSAVQSKLRETIASQASYAKYPVYLFSQVEDPSYIYLLGGWDSVAVHTDDWIPSAANQKIMASLSDTIEVVWLKHLELNPKSTKIPLDAPVIAIGIYFISTDKKSGYERTYAETKHHLEANTALRSLDGGWRLDPEGDGKEEYVLFSGWTAVEEHLKFAESEGFKEFGRTKDFLEGAEIKHVTVWTSS